MLRLNLKLTICNLSCLLQERKLVFSQGSFWEFLVSTDGGVWNKSEAVAAHATKNWFERNDPIVLGFSKSYVCTRLPFIAQPLRRHKCFAFCWSSSPPRTCHMQFFGGTCSCKKSIFGGTCSCSCPFVPHTSIRGNKEFSETTSWEN